MPTATANPSTLTAAPSTSTTLKAAIVTARNTIAAALADQMKAAVLAAIDRTDFHALALDALDGQDIGDAEALQAAAEEILSGHDWEMGL